MEDTSRTYSTNQLSQAHLGSKRLKQKAWRLHGSVLGPLCRCNAFYLDVLVRLLTVGVNMSLNLLPFSILFPSVGLPLPASIKGFCFCQIVSCFVLSTCCVLETCSFLKRKYRGRGFGEEGHVGD